MASFIKKSFVPETIDKLFERLALFLKYGFVLITFTLLFASLIFYTPLDASFNVATSKIIKNKLGAFGSYTADFLIQLFGYAAYWFMLLSSVYILKSFQRERIGAIVPSYGRFILFSLMSTILLGFLLKIDTLSNGGIVPSLLIPYIHKFFFHHHFQIFLPFLSVILILGSIICAGLSLSYSTIDVYHTTCFVVQYFFALCMQIYQWICFLIKKLYVYIQHKRGIDLSNFVLKSPDIKPLSELIPEKKLVEEKKKSIKEDKEHNLFHIFSTSSDYTLPSVDLLDVVQPTKYKGPSEKEMVTMGELLQTVLEEFGIRGEIDQIKPGPVVTMYELKPAPGIKTSRVISLADDIARSMSALSARIAVIPGHNAIGIELPNSTRATVFMRDLLLSKTYVNTKCALPIILGKNIGGEPVVADLTRMPHLLVAGTTGSGKSVSVNAMILSLLFKFSPEQCRFIMIDPKMLELSIYDDIPHLLTPVVTDPKKAVIALKWAVKEMENRYHAMSKLGVRNIDGYNAKVQEAKKSGEILSRRVQTGFDQDTGKPVFETQNFNFEHLPYIVVIVDEMADLMLVAGKDIESAVQRLAQMARAAGIHLIMATQRPSVDVITGTIKANFPTRVSFMVTSKIDSRTILGEQGAEQLLGQGDMLYMAGGGRTQRVHGPFMKDAEVENIVAFLKEQGEPAYIDHVTQDTDDDIMEVSDPNKKVDPVYDQAVTLIRNEGKVSTSFIQRHLSIGYNRAARIVDQMQADGIVSEPNHTGKREILD